jgi:choline dehydrogenase-like flavoprotein
MAQFDYVVVGGGSAGCVLAARLSENASLRVCLVEAGPADDSALVSTPVGAALLVPTRIRNWAFETVPQEAMYQRRGYQPRGRMLGGSSSLNAMIYMRGHPSDYDDWVAAGATGWGWRDVLPHFLRAENNERGASNFHGVGGPLNVADLRSPNPFARLFVEAGKQAGLPENEDFNGAQQEGVGLYQVTQKGGERWNAARAYLHPAMGRPNLAVYTQAHALRVLFEERRATGVEIVRAGRREKLAAAREVVLAAGAFQSPQLLMCSGIGPGEQLRALGLEVVHDAPGVGENLQDHPDYVIIRKIGSSELLGVSLGGSLRLAKEIWRYVRDRRGMLTSNFAEAGGFVKSEPGLERPDLQLHFVIGMVDNHNRTLHLGHGLSCHVCVLRPRSRGTVRLASRDARDAPLIDPRFLAEPEDLAALVRGFKLVRRILDAPALAAFASTELYTAQVRDDAEIERAIRARTDTVYHPAGTCRMGADAGAVLDPELRVRGVEGLRVADCSVMPSLIGGNTNAPAIMIGERAAEFIRRAG